MTPSQAQAPEALRSNRCKKNKNTKNNIFLTYFESIKFLLRSMMLFFSLFPFDYTEQHKKRVYSFARCRVSGCFENNKHPHFFFFVASPEANSVPACFAKYRELFCSESPERLLYIQNVFFFFSITMRAETSSLCSRVQVKYDSSEFYIIFVKP